jgi:hypothetical protein
MSQNKMKTVKITQSGEIIKPTLNELREQLTPFQKELLEEVWQHFRSSGEWPVLRELYSKHTKQKVRQALSLTPLSGSVGWENRNSSSSRWSRYSLTLLGAFLTKEGFALQTLMSDLFQFQRETFQTRPQATEIKSEEIEKRLNLSPDKTQILGQLVRLGNFGGGWSAAPDGPWSISAMEEAENFPPNGNLADYVSEWSCRLYKDDAAVFEDQRLTGYPQVSQIESNIFPNLEAEFSNALASVPKASYTPNTAFIMMWMDKSHPELDDVSNTIKEVCSQFGIKAVRADDIQHQDRITDVILNQIKDSEFLIADLSGERPNVYYEVGFAHSQGKRPILYRKEGTPLHFDLSVHNVPTYRNITELKDHLRKRFEALLDKKPNPIKK